MLALDIMKLLKKIIHRDVMHLRYSTALKGSKKEDTATHINMLGIMEKKMKHYTQLAVT